MQDNIIETFNLSKIYPLKGRKNQIKALDDATFAIKRGEIFGLLGPNGAGKTTLIQILTTLLSPTSGYAMIDGYHLIKQTSQVKAKVALMLESEMLYYRMTVYDNLKFFCKLYNVQDYQRKIQEMTKIFGIDNWLGQYVESLSTGMKMKVALCRTLLLERDILFLDEPTVGLDVKIIASFIEILKNVKKTIIFTSHDLSVVDKLCDRIAFINSGKILKIGTQAELKKLTDKGIRIEISVVDRVNDLISELSKQNFITEINKTQMNPIDIILKERDSYKDLFKVLSNYSVQKITEKEYTLEELFVRTI